jgi:hypothetical protein
LKELTLVTVSSYYYNDDSYAHDLGKVNFFTMAAPKNYYDSDHPLFQKRADLPTLSTLLDILIKNIPIPRYRLLDIHQASPGSEEAVLELSNPLSFDDNIIV